MAPSCYPPKTGCNTGFYTGIISKKSGVGAQNKMSIKMGSQCHSRSTAPLCICLAHSACIKVHTALRLAIKQLPHWVVLILGESESWGRTIAVFSPFSAVGKIGKEKKPLRHETRLPGSLSPYRVALLTQPEINNESWRLLSEERRIDSSGSRCSSDFSDSSECADPGGTAAATIQEVISPSSSDELTGDRLCTAISPPSQAPPFSDNKLPRRHQSLPCPAQPSCQALRLPPQSQSLDTDQNALRLSQYLCGCDHCPSVQSIQAAYGRLSFPSPSDDRRTTVTHRAALLRVLRGCATFDETEALDPALFFTIENLLHDSDGDEDAAFRWVIARGFR